MGYGYQRGACARTFLRAKMSGDPEAIKDAYEASSGFFDDPEDTLEEYIQQHYPNGLPIGATQAKPLEALVLHVRPDPVYTEPAPAIRDIIRGLWSGGPGSGTVFHDIAINQTGGAIADPVLEMVAQYAGVEIKAYGDAVRAYINTHDVSAVPEGTTTYRRIVATLAACTAEVDQQDVGRLAGWLVQAHDAALAELTRLAQGGLVWTTPERPGWVADLATRLGDLRNDVGEIEPIGHPGERAFAALCCHWLLSERIPGDLAMALMCGIAGPPVAPRFYACLDTAFFDRIDEYVRLSTVAP